MDQRRTWIIDSVIGVIAGAIVAAIVAVNVIITAGIGYDVTIAEVFRQNTIVGIATVVIVVAGPILGIAGMRVLRRRSIS